jgi:hypothetical protein
MTPGEGQPKSALRERMHDYKEHDNPAIRAENADVVGAILARYLVDHGEDLRRVTGGWDVMTAVPSKSGRPGRPALAVALQLYENLVGGVDDLLDPGPGSIGHYSPHEEGFTVPVAVDGKRVLLLDDTFTTGATLQSAAHALNEEGAQVVGGLVVARKINPSSRFPESISVWERQNRRTFSFSDRPFWASSAS